MTTIICIFCACLLAVGIYFGAGYYVFRAFAFRNAKRAPAYRAPVDESPEKERLLNLKNETLTLVTQDGLKLSGSLFPSGRNRGALALLAHGYLGSGKEHMAPFAAYYLSRGIDVFLPDHRAHGKSEGKYIGFGETDAADCAAWCRYLAKKFPYYDRIILHGVSMGGATVDRAAADKNLPPQVCGVISDCAFSSCSEQFAHTLRHISPLLVPLLIPANFWFKRLGGYDIFSGGAAEGAAHSPLPFLFIHGAEDRFVPTAMGKELYRVCPDPGRVLWIVPGAKHFGSHTTDPEGYAAHLDAFLARLGL